jgi:urease gamma subunit
LLCRLSASEPSDGIGMKDRSAPSPAQSGVTRQDKVAVVAGIAIVCVGGVGLYVWGRLWQNDAPKTAAADAGILISTFITIYTVFIAGFATLANFVLKRGPRTWRIVAVEFMIVASIVNLARVGNSINDLYDAGVHGLTAFQVKDDAHDFFRYFFMNVVVVAFAVAVACWLPSTASDR